METNWNQLIERYLQNELSEEGRIAFEQELQLNLQLREELEVHQLIQSAAKRASQRILIQQAGKSYLRNLRIKQFALGIVLSAIAAAGIVYWVQNKKHQETNTNERKNEAVVINAQEPGKETITAENQIENQPSQTGDKSSLIQSSGWDAVEKRAAQNAVSFKSSVRENPFEKGAEMLKTIPITFRQDSVPPPGKPAKVSVAANEKQDNELIQAKTDGMDFSKLYDTIGKFNDLYCGYALVMSNAKIGFIDRKGNIFIPLIYDEIIVSSNIQSSKDKHKRRGKGKQVLYIPKRSGSEVQYCEENLHPFFETDSRKVK